MCKGNKQIVIQALTEIWQNGNIEKIHKFYRPDFVNHTLKADQVQSLEREKQSVVKFRTAFSNFKVIIEDILASEDKVILRGGWQGIHTGNFGNMAPTDKQVTVGEIAIFRLVDGQIAELWASTDQLGLLRQLGVSI